MPSQPIARANLEHYREHGYTVVRGLIPEPDLATYRDRLEQIIEGTVAPASRMLVMRDVMIARGAAKATKPMEAIAKLQDYENDPVLDGYNQHPTLLDAVEQIIGPDLQSIHCMLINKPPGVDGRHPLHQDLVYFPFRPAEWVVGTWTALEPVTRKNGCLVVVPGTQKGELLEHADPDWEFVNAGYWGVRDIGAHEGRVHIECEPGDTVFFHPLILHGSGRNETQGYRRAISCHYASTRCEKIWDESETDDTRWYRPLRGALPDYGEVPRGVARPGHPGVAMPQRSTRRAN